MPKKLTELEIEEMLEDLDNLQMMIEACPTEDWVTLRDLCDKKDRLLMKLNRFENPFSKKQFIYLTSNQ